MTTARRPSSATMLRLALIAALLPMATGCGDEAATTDAVAVAPTELDGRMDQGDLADARAELIVARERWDAAAVGDHRISISEMGTVVTEFDVRDGTIVGVVSTREWIVPEAWTVPARFDQLASLIDAAEESPIDLETDNACAGVYFFATVDPDLGYLGDLDRLSPCDDGVSLIVEVTVLPE